MPCAQAALILALVSCAAAAPRPAAAQPKKLSGESALAFTRAAVGFGPRPSGSVAIQRLQAYLRTQLRGFGVSVTEDAFTARTPQGPVAMRNFIVRLPGTTGKAIAITGHYDTKILPGFVGANDGGSSTGLLLELARVLAKQPRVDDVYLVFFDGEEAVRDWSATDSLYGSRHLAERWAADGTLKRLKALINIDMIGDRDLGLVQVSNSSQSLLQLVWSAARDLGHGRHFTDQAGMIEDDHVPFLNRGVNALDLIDFDYGPNNGHWHTAADTLDKLSPRSLEIVGNVLLETIRRLETR
jgi:glutaminyl-peptide cyclotransferase